ncbi:MAG: RloB domain-containing protein [Bacteroidetes bacterium]|nr:RloB domain-containing protein [Bacteroidota bacterium]
MGNKRNASRGKKINPHFWVFCEGKTEEAYVIFLRSLYRLPIEVVPKISGSDINIRYIESYKRNKPTHEKDRDFLIYDADILHIIEKLRNIPNVNLIISNPAIELWFLLHYKNQITSISAAECVRQLENRNKNTYKKGLIDEQLKTRLKEKYKEACNRARQLRLFENPSTNMFLFIEALESAKQEKLAEK